MKTPLERATTLVEQQYKRNQEAVQLAKLASLAVSVEPHLLRRLRLELLPDADVGIEADLWFGPLVESRGVRAIVLNRYVVELLREKLAEDRQLLRRVIALTEQAHAESATTIRLEERLTAIAVLNESDVQQQIDEALRPALRTMQVGGEDARQLAHWAMRALSQAHPSVRESANAIALGLSATLALGGRPILREVPKLTGGLGDMTWLLRGAISVPPARIGVELVARGVAFAEPGGEQPQLELPATNPLVLSLAWKTDGGDAQMLVEAVAGRTVELDAEVTQVELRTLSGDEYLLSAVSPVESPAETTSEDLGARHFDIDVFISYAHVDDLPNFEQKGWVTELHEILQRLLTQRMGRAVKTWMDQNLSGAEGFANEMIDRLSKTAVMVSVLSPAYLNSEYCINEVNKFCQLAEQTGGVAVDNRSRVFKVIKTPVDFELTQRLPSSVLDTGGYKFVEINKDEIPKGLDSDLEAKIRAAIKMGRDDIATAYINQFKQAQMERIARDLANDIAQMLSRLSAEPLPQPPTKQSSEIFVCYSRGDSGNQAVRLFDKLADHFGKDRIFMDVMTIKPGEDFAEVIENAVSSCEIMIAIIGRRWFSDSIDYVRKEIVHALNRGIRVIPVLVQGASMPEPQELPDDLAKLARVQNIELSDSHWQDGVDQLISTVERVLATELKLPPEVRKEERRLHNDARRFARLLISEMKLYNEQKVKQGRSENNIYERLREEIDRAREMYDKRTSPSVAAINDYFHQELVDILAEGDIRKLGSRYPGPSVPTTH